MPEEAAGPLQAGKVHAHTHRVWREHLSVKHQRNKDAPSSLLVTLTFCPLLCPSVGPPRQWQIFTDPLWPPINSAKPSSGSVSNKRYSHPKQSHCPLQKAWGIPDLSQGVTALVLSIQNPKWDPPADTLLNSHSTKALEWGAAKLIQQSRGLKLVWFNQFLAHIEVWPLKYTEYRTEI